MKTSGLKFCLKAATTLTEDDLETITDAVANYTAAGMMVGLAETRAVDDAIAQVTREREAIIALARAQYPDLFTPLNRIDEAANQAATSPTNDLPDPTPAQKAAGNYRMGHLSLHGLDITVENPKGSERRAVDGSWVVPSMPAHYGYIKRSLGADGDHADVFIGPSPDSTTAWIINQKHPDGALDEHKVMLGFDSPEAAKAAYMASFTGGWGEKVFESISAPMAIDSLKATLPRLQKAKPLKRASPNAGKGGQIENRPDQSPAKNADLDAAALLADDDFKAAMGDLGDIIGAQFRASLTPEQRQKLLPVMSRLFDAAFRKGLIEFRRAARAVLEALRAALGPAAADAITIDDLQAGYIMASQGKDGATPKRDVVSIETKEELEAPDVSGSGTDLERDSGDAAAGDAPVEGDLPGAGSGAGTRVAGVPAGSRRSGPDDNPGFPAGGALASGERGDQPVPAGDRQDQLALSAPGDSDSLGGGRPGGDGIQPDRETGRKPADAAGRELAALEKAARQKAAQSVKVIPGDLANIRESLPFLLDGQQEDVLIAETRFAKPDGYGMLFANGTGTGKTFMALGVVKRLERQGKTNVLIAVPDDKIMADWVKSGKSLFLDITPLANTKDAGRGIVITTYANLQDNDVVASRDWDMVVADEAHKLVQNADGDPTGALRKLRAISLHPDGAYDRYQSIHAKEIARAESLVERLQDVVKKAREAEAAGAPADALNVEADSLLARSNEINAALREKRKAVEADVVARQGATRPRALFLSATPFAYVKTIDWAQGYLFDYREGYPHTETSLGYNTPNPQQYFFQIHFGYQMRTGKLNKPDAKVDSGAMERAFNGWLKKRGVLSNRTLDVDADYDRRFILAESAVGTEIDRALQWVAEQADTSKPENTLAKGFELLNADLSESLFGKTGHLTRRYLLEAIKAKEVIPHVRAHLALGRKVVVFHDFKKGGSRNPFAFPERKQMSEWKDHTAAELAEYNATVDMFNRATEAFRAEFPLLAGDVLSELQSPIERFRREFEDVLVINGDEKKKDVLARYNRFNDDAVGPIVALVQSDKNAGWSGHDTTGKHQRVLFNLGLPTQPTKTIQTEGRIYRTGQVSNAIMRYLNTGTNWERWAFAETIATRSATVDNLASGESARALKDAFIAGFEESGDFPAGHEGEGTGGKARDKMLDKVASLFDRAMAFYWGTQKKNSRTKAQEGEDYFATPEPLGLKMVEWADIRPGEDVLEPSGGHGAIARWFPDSTTRTAIEPSMPLGSRMALVFDGKLVRDTFENLHVVNKYDAIVMNPPFGVGGSDAIPHLAKAATHLNPGGRIVALIPTGPAADKKFDKWFSEEETRPAKPLGRTERAGDFYDGDMVELDGRDGRYRIVGRNQDGTLGVQRVGSAGSPESFRSHYVARVVAAGPRKETYKLAEGLSLVADIKLPGVTFERAGTGVMTRIVIIDKGDAPGQVNRDYSDAEDINAFFERIRDADMPARRKKATDSAATLASDPAPADAAPEQPYSGPEEVVEHTTGKGKVLKGIVRTGITKAEAQQIDKFTFPKNGGWFIRLKHLNGDGAFSRADARSNAVMPREATTFDEAREAARAFVGRAMRNAATGETATVSNTTLAKMLSGSSANKSTSSQDHAQAVANADVLFERSLLDSSTPDVRGEPTIAAIQRFVAPMVTADGSVVAVKLTVKKTVSPLQPNPLYTIETIDVQKPALGAPISGIEREPGQNRNSPQAGFSESVQQLLRDAQAAQDGPMSRAQPGMGSAIRDVNRVADRVRKVFPNAPGINVLPSSQYAPADLREFMAAEGMLNEADGVYWGGEVWIFANKIASPARAEWVMLHEFGHAGMRALFPMEIERRAKFATMLATNPDLQARVARLMEGRPEVRDMIDAVDEVLADTAASGERPSWLMEIVAWVRAQLRRAGLITTYTDNDILSIVAMGRDRLRRGDSGSLAGAFSRRIFWDGYRTVNDFIVPETPEFEDNMTGDLALIPDAARKHGIEPLPVRLAVGAVFAPHRGFGLEHIRSEAEANPKREAPSATQDRAENFARQVTMVIRDARALYVDGKRLALRSPLMKLAVILERRGDYYSVVSLVPSERPVWGVPVWSGRLAFPESSRSNSEPPYQSSGLDATASAPERAGVQTEKYEFNRPGPAIQVKKKRKLDDGNFSRADTGQVAAPAQLAPAGIVDAALRIPMQALGVDKLTRNAGRALTDMLAKFIPEKVKAGVVDDFGLGEVYVDRRASMYGQQRRGLREAKGLYDRIATVSREEAAVLYAAANNADSEQVEALIANLSPEGQAVLREVKQRVQDMGREQVRLGLLSAQAFERNEWAYLRRSYRKYEEAQTEKVRQRRGRAIQVWGDAYIGRGLFDSVDPAKLQGRGWFGTKSKDGQADKQAVGQKFIRLERRKPSGEGVENLPGIEGKKPKGKLIEAVYWKADEPIPPQYAEFENAGVWEARDTKGAKVVMWRDFTPDERKQMGEIDDFRYAMLKTMHFATHNVEVGRFLEWVADTQSVPDEDRLPPGAEVREANESLSVTYGRDVWVQVPSSKAGQSDARKYGKLAGLYVPGPVWNDLRQIVRTQHIQPFGELYADVLRFWKVSKALALDTPIPTPDGWTTMGDIKVGDRVFDEQGKVCEVIGATEVQLDRKCFEVAFSDGTKITADAEHLWFTVMQGAPGVRTTEQIRATLKERTRGDNNHKIPVAGALDLPDAALPIPPYALGVWLGDGHTRAARVSAGGEDAAELIGHLSESGVRCSKPGKDKRNNVFTFQMRRPADTCLRGHDAAEIGPKGCRVCANIAQRGAELPAIINPHLQVKMRGVGLLGNKHIPAAYLRASEGQRRELLMGLMDTDGHITESGHCAFTTTLPALRDGFLELARSLGYKPTVVELQPSCNGKLGKVAWRMHFKAYADRPVFKSERKRARLAPPRPTRQRSQTRQIVSITPVPSVPVRCIAVSSESRLYLAGEGMVPTHNTALSPVVHMNNVVSNIVMADWHDVTARDIITGLRTYLRRDTDAAAKTAFEDFEDAGGTQGLYVLSEIQKDQLEPLLEKLEAELDEAGEARGTVGVLAALQFVLSRRLSDGWAALTSSKPGKGVQKAAGLMMDMYEAEDTVFRFAAYLKAIEQGLTPQEAGKIARKSFLDYSINAPWIQLMRNTAFPFVSFVYRAIPMLWDVMQNKPWKLAKLALMIGAANALGYAMSGGDEDRERALLPEELSGRVLGVIAPKLVRMPWNDQHGSPVYLDIRRWIPIGDIVDSGATNSAFPILPAMLPGGPLMMLGELLLNQSAFTGREITKESDTLTERGMKVAGYLYKAFAPNLPGLPNTWSTESIANAATGKTDAFGREVASVGAAALGAVGVKARSYPVDQLALNARARFAGQSREINAEIRALARQASRKGITSEEFEEGRADALEKLRNLEAELRAKIEAAQL